VKAEKKSSTAPLVKLFKTVTYILKKCSPMSQAVQTHMQVLHFFVFSKTNRNWSE